VTQRKLCGHGFPKPKFVFLYITAMSQTIRRYTVCLHLLVSDTHVIFPLVNNVITTSLFHCKIDESFDNISRRCLIDRL